MVPCPSSPGFGSGSPVAHSLLQLLWQMQVRWSDGDYTGDGFVFWGVFLDIGAGGGENAVGMGSFCLFYFGVGRVLRQPLDCSTVNRVAVGGVGVGARQNSGLAVGGNLSKSGCRGKYTTGFGMGRPVYSLFVRYLVLGSCIEGGAPCNAWRSRAIAWIARAVCRAPSRAAMKVNVTPFPFRDRQCCLPNAATSSRATRAAS